MKPGTAYRTFYHLTHLENMERIKLEGIKPSKNGMVYLCDNKLDPFFMAPCGRAARTRFALSMIDKQPFFTQLALIEVLIPFHEAKERVRKLPFTWFEGDRLIENKSTSIYQQYLYSGTIPWDNDMSFEVYTFCDPEQLRLRWGISESNNQESQQVDKQRNADIQLLLERIANVLPC